MTAFKCLCGAEYRLIPDEETDGLPPSFTARQFYCVNCGGLDWLECYDLGYDEWPEDMDDKR